MSVAKIYMYMHMCMCMVSSHTQIHICGLLVRSCTDCLSFLAHMRHVLFRRRVSVSCICRLDDPFAADALNGRYPSEDVNLNPPSTSGHLHEKARHIDETCRP